MTTPQVGWHANHHLLGDTYEGTVVAVRSPTRVVVECHGHREEVSLRKDGFWVSKGATVRSAGRWSFFAGR